MWHLPLTHWLEVFRERNTTQLSKLLASHTSVLEGKCVNYHVSWKNSCPKCAHCAPWAAWVAQLGHGCCTPRPGAFCRSGGTALPSGIQWEVTLSSTGRAVICYFIHPLPVELRSWPPCTELKKNLFPNLTTVTGKKPNSKTPTRTRSCTNTSFSQERRVLAW